MALQSSQRSQLWRNEAMRRLHRWEVDFEEAVRSIPESERRKSPPDSDWRAPRYPIDPRSPYLLRRRKVPEFDPPLTGNRDTPESSSESDTALPRIPSSPVPVQRRKRQRTLNPRSGPKDSGQSRPPNKDYCTQACLQGLTHKREFDPECPNLSFHQKHSSNGRHPLSRSDLVKLVSEQLNRDPDHCCRPMGKEGLHGSLFTITLDAYGYTFVGKGTEYTSNYEARIYQALKALQGYAVPVYLGDIYLRQNIYYLPTRAVVHISLMSWGGKALKEAECPFFKNEIDRTRSEINDAGIEHLDERAPNMLWNEEVQRVMFIDFGRAQVTRKRKSSVRKLHSSKPKRQRMAVRYEVVV